MFTSLAACVATPAIAQKTDKAGHQYWEVFYRGGDSHLSVGGLITMMLDDSTVLFYWKSSRYEAPDFTIRIRAIRELSGRSNRVGASLTNWASGDEAITITYDGDKDAEAPVFKTDGGDSGQILARIRARMRKLGMLGADQ
jgi:hypothetical protein